MQQKSINHSKTSTQSLAIEFVQWLTHTANAKKTLEKQVLALQTTRLTPNTACPNPPCGDQTNPYQYFNLGLHVGDCAQQVQKNRQSLQNLLPESTKVQWLEQVHGNEVVEIRQVSAKAIVADAVVTRTKNTCLAIMTADCLPILLVSKAGDEIAAIHGGWRPLAANIILNTLDKMKTPNVDVCAWLGPCISNNAFEVGSEVKSEFVQQGEYFDSAFTAKEKGKYLADLHKIARLQLANLGVNQISALSECTYANTDKYYSYRKDTVTGRMATLICLL